MLAVFAFFTSLIYQNNPVFFGTPKKGFAVYDHTIYDFHPYLDDELFPLAFSIDKDFGAYRNHCLRVLTFTKHFLPESVEEELPDAMELAATAIAYLKIGLWTGDDLNYVVASKDKLERSLGGSFSSDKMRILTEIILQQHELSDYKGLKSDAANDLINAVRKASWTDGTMGLFRFDLPPSLLENTYDEVGASGFHRVFWRKLILLSPSVLTGVKRQFTREMIAQQFRQLFENLKNTNAVQTIKEQLTLENMALQLQKIPQQLEIIGRKLGKAVYSLHSYAQKLHEHVAT